MMKKCLFACLALVLVFSVSFSVAADSPEVVPMYQFSDLGIDPGASAEEIATKAAALMELVNSIQALNEQRKAEIELRVADAKAAQAEAKVGQADDKARLSQMKEQTKQLEAKAKVLGLQLQIAVIEAESNAAPATADVAD